MIISKKLRSILSLMSNPISCFILEQKSEIAYDYIDISNSNDSVSFITSNKRDELLSNLDIEYTLTSIDGRIRYLSRSDANSAIFERLGYDRNSSILKLEAGVSGKIISETISKIGSEICLFEHTIKRFNAYKNEYEDFDTKRIVLNKKYLTPIETKKDFLWKKNRNSIKIGRLVRSLLLHSNFSFIEKDIETFVNLFKSTYDIEQDALNKFSLENGKNISKWYNMSNYMDGCLGQLNNSCMRSVPGRYFNIYKDNGVKLLIQFSDGGKMINDKYISDKIKGRALLWEDVKLDGVDGYIKFLDRVYTHSDSDVDLFREYAKLNGWYWKDINGYITNGVDSYSYKLNKKLDKIRFMNYPYSDTFRYMNKKDGILHTGHLEYDSTLARTDGRLNIR